MEIIVKTTYKLSTLEYHNNGWQGTAEMDDSEFESFDKAALIELLCKELLRIVIEDYIISDATINDSDWETLRNDFEFFVKNNVIISELFPTVKFEEIQYDDKGEIYSFSISLSKNINSVVCDCIYLTFEY